MLQEDDQVVNNWRISSQVNPCWVIFDFILHSVIEYKVKKSDVDERMPDLSLQHDIRQHINTIT